MDLANQHRPKNFKEIKGSASNPGGIVDYITYIIENNLLSQVNKFLISGPPGTGKTTISNLFARSVLCYNRPKNSSIACGKCEVCTEQEVPNIYRYTITSPTTAREKIKYLIEQSYRSPELNEKFKVARQFIILEETQQASPELMAELLEPLEKAPDTTTWIIGTMNLEKLNSRDPTLKEALESRCKELKLTAFSETQIAETLILNTHLNKESAKAIAYFSNGNMRKAYSLLSHFNLNKKENEINEQEIFNYLIGGASKKNRDIFWQELAKGNPKRIIDIINNWVQQGAETKALAKVLEEDLMKKIIKNPKNLFNLELLRDLSKWTCQDYYHLSSVFLPYLNNQTDQVDQIANSAIVSVEKPEAFKNSFFWEAENLKDLF